MPTFNLANFQKTDDPSAEHALARLVDGHTSSGQAIGQIRRRLQYCLAHHNHCKVIFSGITPRRFLSVGRLSDPTVAVVQAQNPNNGNAEPYAALSYCWGHDQVLKTTSANKAYMENGIPLSSLPKTITDAIRITRELGIKLLWVDSLCLVQDEEDELAKEIAKMHHYFGNAYITISAAVPASCSEGFLQDHPITPYNGSFPFGPFYFPVDIGIPNKSLTLKLIQFRLEDEAIDSRAWTLQEGLLSHRLASFGSRVVRWSCRTESYGKHIHDSRELHQSLSAVRSGTEKLSDHQVIWRKLVLWCNIVENYSRRDLSNQGDKLPAISGIASALSAPLAGPPERQQQVDFIAGFLVHPSLTHPLCAVGSSRLEIKYHPRDHFESGILALQLLWHAPSTRPGKLSTGLETRKRSSQRSPYIAPSWSWASHVGAVGMAISTIAEEWRELFILMIGKQGPGVREIVTIPSKSEAPYGALSWGSITLNGYIFRPDEEPSMISTIAFDDGRHDIAPGDCSGLFCLQITPNFNRCEDPRFCELMGHLWDHSPPSSLCWRLHGIVLEPVELEGHFSSGEKVHRRVGVYYIPKGRLWVPPERGDMAPRPFSVSSSEEEEEEVRGRFETITII